MHSELEEVLDDPASGFTGCIERVLGWKMTQALLTKQAHPTALCPAPRAGPREWPCGVEPPPFLSRSRARR